jgi:REP element-mobilizing transposase RayT
MVHGYHVVLGAYGFWLPNDPRGSWSDFVAKWELLRFGRATKHVAQRGLRELSASELAQRAVAQAGLKYPPVQFSGMQAHAIARGFAQACRDNGYTIWACAIMPEHTHLVIARYRYKVEHVANVLKGAATRQIIVERLHPLARFAAPGKRPPCMWAVGHWQAFLDDDEAIEAAVEYVEQNPLREGKSAQRWKFVTPFQGLEVDWITYH